MREHQRYFHLVDEAGQLLPVFLTVANVDSPKPEIVIKGNERVITPRLTDAEFFYDKDLKQRCRMARIAETGDLSGGAWQLL